MKPWIEVIKTHLGLIILGICFIIGCNMIFVALKSTRNPAYGYQSHDGVEITAGMSAFSHQLAIKTNGGDVSYKSEITVGAGKRVNVISSDSRSTIFEGENITVKFFHVSRLLIVEYMINGELQVTYFNNPISCNIMD